jgi:LysR family transcriptional regulator, low CO2-responsive transcriptional regulator
MKDISLRHWRSFEAAAAFGSFSRAAEALELTQPAVSMQLKQLEDAVGLLLFDKQARPMVLTPAGQVMLRHARAILAEVRVAEDAVAALAAGLQGLLNLGVVAPANYFVPALLQAFHRRHPQLRVQLVVDKRDALLAQLAEYRLDLAITGYPPAEADVEALTFAHHPHVVVVAANHPLAGREAVAWTELAHEPVVLRERGSVTRQFMEHIWQNRKLRPPIAAELPGNETVKQAVMTGLGLSLMSAHVIQLELEAAKLAVLPLPDTPKRLDWCVLQRRDRELGAAAASLRDFLVAEGAVLTACRVG